jgi:hypothetical protein
VTGSIIITTPREITRAQPAIFDIELEARPAGERAADIGIRLSYADLDDHTETDPVAALDHLPAGDVDFDVVANCTAFYTLRQRLGAGR